MGKRGTSRAFSKSSKDVMTALGNPVPASRFSLIRIGRDSDFD
jgi:hypothetical protein